MDTRVQDYLDDKFQAAADLETLDSLLSNVQQQQALLKQQLDEARQAHRDARQNAQEHHDAIQMKAQRFEQEQEDIDRRLLIATQSNSSDDALHKFEASMEKLRNLDLAAGYVELLKEVDALSFESLSHLGKSDDVALDLYQRLQQLVTSLKPLHESAEGAAPHLSDYISASVTQLHRKIEETLSKNLEATLAKMNWPKMASAVPMALQKEWNTNIGRLLDLQRQSLEGYLSQSSSKEDPLPLLPLQILVRPLEQRFTYHFSGNKPTNRLDKPQFFLSHVTDLIREHAVFVQDNVQSIILQHFRYSEDLFSVPAYVDATSAFITALIPMLKRKLYSVANQVARQPSLLSNLVQEVIAFDTSLMESYAYTPISPDEPWRGLSYFLLTTCGHFDEWLSAEKTFALQRYHSIVESADAGEIDYDAVSADATKPTKSAIRVNDLLETITGRYRDLTSFTQKIKFLIDIQIEIFDMYYRRLNDSHSAYLTATSSLVRTMHSLSKEDQAELQGVKGLDRLCRIYGSAYYLEHAMLDWSDDVFFLELWVELDYRAKNPGDAGINVGNGWQDLQQRTSSTFGAAETNGKMEGALFDETAGSYHKLRVRSENTLTEILTSSVGQALRPYGSIATWASLSQSSAGISVSSELDATLRLLNEYLGFLRRAIGKAPLRRISKQVCHTVQSYILSNVLTSRVAFSTAGATQLVTDVRAVCVCIDRYAGSGQAQKGMKKLLEAVTLLGLPVRGEIPTELPSRSGDAEDEENEDASAWDDADALTRDEDIRGQQLSLFQAEKLVFANNEGARKALEQLGLDTLTEAEAREILRKRVELGS